MIDIALLKLSTENPLGPIISDSLYTLAPYSLSAAPSERTKTKLEPYKAWLAASPTLCFVNGDMFMISTGQLPNKKSALELHYY